MYYKFVKKPTKIMEEVWGYMFEFIIDKDRKIKVEIWNYKIIKLDKDASQALHVFTTKGPLKGLEVL